MRNTFTFLGTYTVEVGLDLYDVMRKDVALPFHEILPDYSVSMMFFNMLKYEIPVDCH